MIVNRRQIDSTRKGIEKKMFKFVAVPKGESWGCLLCSVDLNRDVNAVRLLKEGEPRKRGVVSTGLCANHAETFNRDSFKKMQRKFDTLTQ